MRADETSRPVIHDDQLIPIFEKSSTHQDPIVKLIDRMYSDHEWNEIEDIDESSSDILDRKKAKTSTSTAENETRLILKSNNAEKLELENHTSENTKFNNGRTPGRQRSVFFFFF
jgi:hypothetical protein